MVAVMKAIAFNQCGLGSIPARFHMWVEFVVSSSVAPRVFLGLLQLSPHKNKHSKVQFHQYKGSVGKPPKAHVVTSLNIYFCVPDLCMYLDISGPQFCDHFIYFCPC